MTGDGRDRGAPAGADGRSAGRRSDGRPRSAAASARPEDSIGEYLARQRRLRGISIDELCERTRIPRRNIERLEGGAFDEQRDGFARGFVRTIAAALGLDVDEAVMRLMREPAAGEERDRGVDLRVHVQRFLVVAGLLLVVFALWALGSALRGAFTSPREEPSVVYRPDVVRQLAEEAAAPPPPPPREPAGVAEEDAAAAFLSPAAPQAPPAP